MANPRCVWNASDAVFPGLGQEPDQERDQPAIGPLREIARVGEVLEQEPGKQ
jgi:hypothetical protein